MIKRILIFIIIIIAIATAAIFIYRYQIFQYSAETIIRKLLPDCIRIDKINFDIKNNRVILTDFKIINPDDFSNQYLLEIENITCGYRTKGGNILDGLEILEPSFKHLTLNIERLADGRLNLEEIKKYIERQAPKETAAAQEARGESAHSKIVGDKTLPDILKLPQVFSLKDGTVIFIDRLPYTKPHMITFENIDAKLGLKLNASYTALLYLTSTGKGDVNGDRNEVVTWDISLTPTTPKLTMSSRFEVYNVDMISFEPYYDKYSPFVFKTGRFSGTLIFDFDNGNIGSTNEVHLADVKFWIKKGYENAQFWETTVPDLAKYFTSSFGEIVFDFKIKGQMSNPKFYLGPISKQALTSMAIDKISSAISGQDSAPGAPKSGIEKAKEYIDLFKGLINKK